MATRLDLQNKLEEFNGNRNVYYDPPENLKMEYDAIRYSKKKPSSIYANDAKYKLMNCYEIIVISRKSDSPVVGKLMALPYCSYDRDYEADNLYHDVLTLYW